MLKDREFKRLLMVELVILLCAIIAGMLINFNMYDNYKRDLIENNSIIVGTILKHHPELESDVIDGILRSENLSHEGLSVLKKYGIDDIDNLNSLPGIKELKNEMIRNSWVFTGTIFILVSAVYGIFVSWQYKKIHQMNRYMQNVFNGDYSLDIRDYNEGNMSNLKNEIYKMTVLLKTQTDLAKTEKNVLAEVLSDISHQIKTPLTSMYMMNDLLQDEKLDPVLKKEFLAKNKAQLERMEWLVSSLLKISRIDNGAIRFKKERVNVLDLINQSLAPLRIPIELKNQTVTVDCAKDIAIDGDEHWLIETLVNILKNAHEHTNQDGKIEIHVDKNPIYTSIVITDNGCGICKEDLPHVFERFYKGTTSSNESIGIGLNMAKKILDKQNADIKVTSKEGTGTTFTIQFYKNVI